MEITSGVAQGSNLGLGLWNTSYESLLRFDIPEESCPVGYEDVVAALVAGRTVEQAQSTISEPAIMVIAEVIPVALLAKERKVIYRDKSENRRKVVAREEH